MKMKQILLVPMLALLFVACESKESKAIKTYTESEFIEHPGVKIKFEEIRQDSIHTVGDSLNILYTEYCSHPLIKETMDEKNYILDSMSTTQFADTCMALLQLIENKYIIDLEDAIKELDEYDDALDATSSFGLSSLFSDFGVDLSELETKLETKVSDCEEVIDYINSVIPLFQSMKILSTRAKEDVLVEFWYCQYTAKDRSQPIIGERRYFERIHLRSNEDIVEVMECVALESTGEPKKETLFDF